MIFAYLLSMFFGLVTPLLDAISFASPVIGDLSGAATIGSSLGQANRYLPIDQFVILIVAGLAFDLSLTGATFTLFVYRLIPFKLS